MKEPKYLTVQNHLKGKIQQGLFKIGDYLPSENELCFQYSITRTTVRKAMDELQKDGFIERQQGKGSRVRERRKSLGLLTVKGFSEAVGQNVQTIMLQNPVIVEGYPQINFGDNQLQKFTKCIYFERLRKVDDKPVMIEKNWIPGTSLNGLLTSEFVEGSFFKTLSRNYLIEITGSEHELRAEFADTKTAELLKIKKGAPVLHISVKFNTSNSGIVILSELFCNTSQYPVGNSYYI